MLDPVPDADADPDAPDGVVHEAGEHQPAVGYSLSSYEQALENVSTSLGSRGVGRVFAGASFEYLVNHDSLTGLLNRRGFLEELAGLLRKKGPEGQLVGLLTLDLDYFMGINEDLGMAAGDEVLQVVAERLRAISGDSAVIARVSGDEFAILDHFASTVEGNALAGELLEALKVPMPAGGAKIEITASIGVAMACHDDTLDGLVGRAAAAVNEAKRRGRNRCQMESPNLEDPADRRLRRRGEMRQAIEEGELCLFYQPQIDLSTGQMNGFEALVRWDHPTKGLLGPAAFIDFAEESGLILPLGEWVINAAVEQQARWHRAVPGRVPVRMSVNISAIQLNDPRLEQMVTEALQHHDVIPDLLTLEITETALTEDPVAALVNLQILNALGVRLAIDDFGTGHSSLTYLKRFPIDELKIDRSFIAGLTTDSKDHAIVSSCIQLAHATNLIAVAEGVETADQLGALTDLGCDLAQGYFYSRPMSAEDLEPWFVPRPDTVQLQRQNLVDQDR